MVADLFEGQIRVEAAVRFKEEALPSFRENGDEERTRRRKCAAFIISRSALPEGRDSPKLFQICKLDQTTRSTF